MLAFSTISHTGVMLIGLGLLNSLALAGAGWYLFGHAMVKGALFIGAGILLHHFSSVDEFDLHGRAKKYPGLALIMIVAAMGLLALPPFGTFFGEAMIERAAEQADLRWLSVIFIIASVFTGGTLLRVIGRVFFGLGSGEPPVPGRPEGREDRETTGPPGSTPISMWLPPVVLLIIGASANLVPAIRAVTVQHAASMIDTHLFATTVLYGNHVQLTPGQALPGFSIRRSLINLAGAGARGNCDLSRSRSSGCAQTIACRDKQGISNFSKRPRRRLRRVAGARDRRLGQLAFVGGALMLRRSPRPPFKSAGLSYRIRPIDVAACDVEIRVAGKWTARFVPRPLVWLWLTWFLISGLLPTVANLPRRQRVPPRRRRAEVQFNGVLGGEITRNRGQIVRLHLVNRDNSFRMIEINNIERKPRVLHPEIEHLLIGEDEQHPVIARHAVTLHQTLFQVRFAPGDLELESFLADAHVDGRKTAARGTATRGNSQKYECQDPADDSGARVTDPSGIEKWIVYCRNTAPSPGTPGEGRGAGVRAISNVESRWYPNSPPPQPSPGVPAEGAVKKRFRLRAPFRAMWHSRPRLWERGITAEGGCAT